MSSVVASISQSVDGYVTGPGDGPGAGLGRGGERLHYWVMGGPWTYAGEHDTAGSTGVDREFLEGLAGRIGSGVVGRGMYEAAGAWGGTNPFPGTLVVLTHRVEDQPPAEAGFELVDGLEAAVARARELAGDLDISLGGGADLIRQALAAGLVDELALTTAPVVLGGGKRLFEGFDHDVELEPISVQHSAYAVHVRYRVLSVRPAASSAGSR